MKCLISYTQKGYRKTYDTEQFNLKKSLQKLYQKQQLDGLDLGTLHSEGGLTTAALHDILL